MTLHRLDNAAVYRRHSLACLATVGTGKIHKEMPIPPVQFSTQAEKHTLLDQAGQDQQGFPLGGGEVGQVGQVLFSKKIGNRCFHWSVLHHLGGDQHRICIIRGRFGQNTKPGLAEGPGFAGGRTPGSPKPGASVCGAPKHRDFLHGRPKLRHFWGCSSRKARAVIRDLSCIGTY